MSLKGIDVSVWQKSIDWAKVKKETGFAIIRLGWVGNSRCELDTYFARNYSEAKKQGIPIGVYVYNYVSTPNRAKTVAKWVLEQLKDKSLELPIYLDMEDKTLLRLGKNTLTDICIAFNEEIEKAGLWAGVYANRNWFDNYLHGAELRKRYTTWIAHYGVSENKYKGEYDMLQYTSAGKVNGIAGKVDMNIMYRDLINEIANIKESEGDEMGLIYNTYEELPEWAKPTIKKLIDAGALKGDNKGNLDLPYQVIRVYVTLDRLGVLDKQNG
jgi:GH25 family lysozyme M1 (1,4-beta-N-acetylmuramidase)